MFDLLAPGNLVLTLQSKPPFVLESAFAVALTVLLAAPLIARVYLLFNEPLKNFAKRPAPSCRRRGRSSESLVIRYPAREVADVTSSSELCLGAAREINSTSAARGDNDVSRRRSSREQVEDDDVVKKIEARELRKRKRPSLSRLLSSIATACRPFDISGLDYKAYRHRLIEASLRQQYDDYQPPGDVVLNSLHLNSADSVIGVRLNDHYDHSLFDFVEEYYDATKTTSRENAGRQPHPLDHFLVRGARRPKTAERQTETQPEDDVDRESFGCESARDYLPVNVDSVSPKSPSVDTNGNPHVQPPSNASTEQKVVVRRNDLDSTPTRPRVRAFKETRESSLKEDRRKSSWTTKNRSASAGSASTLQGSRALSRAATLPENRRLLGSPGRRRSADRFGESAKKLEDQPNRPQSPSSSYGRTGGGRQEETRANFFPRSSSEIISVYSEYSGKHRDETSCRSRESSISPRSRARPPWLSGNRGSSFNRKYANIAKDSARTGQPVSARGRSLPRQSAAPSGGRLSKPVSRGSTLPGLRANVIASRQKEHIRVPAEEKQEEEEEKEEREEEEEEEEREQDVTATSPRPQEDELKEKVGRRNLVAQGSDGTVRIPRASGSPEEGVLEPAISRFPRDNAVSFSSPRTRACTSRKPQASFDASASVTSATTPRIRATRGPRSARLVPDPGKKQPTRNTRDTSEDSKPPLMQDGRTSVARLNRGRRAANAASVKAAPLDSKIELSRQVLNSADDTGDERSVPPSVDSTKVGEHASQVAPPRESAERMTGGDGADAQEVPGVKNALGQATAENNAGSNNSNRVARPRAPETTRNLRPRPASAGHHLAESHRVAPRGASTARKSANSETAGGVKRVEPSAGSARARLLLREHGAVDGAEARGKCSGATGTAFGDEEELRLPRHDSKIGLAMNSALRRYIETLKLGLLDRSDKHGVALASLSLTDAISILSGEKAPLSAEETRELQSVLSRVERNPELLLRKTSPSSADNTA
ncbi:nucleolar and coiled-body phosphoprotein 1-like [Odontomachus brunneus]|uniref:nucleolar and coiled-body phosphoprotein 1-like n=1 Tax=Odontomachus brunneus TaxID=486640 RepID=UPI0013F1853E|nr:nucleolar and coiled-body phosphoprotein 1-like [Odontomachus brunneus]